MLLYYDFNDNSNPATVPDGSGNGNTGIINSNAAYTAGPGAPVDGGAGRAMTFDGAGDHVRPNNDATAFDTLSTLNRGTVGFWMLGDPAVQPRAQINFGAYNNSPPAGVDSRQFQAHAPWSDSNVYFDTGGCCGADTRLFGGVPESDYTDDPTIAGADWDHWVFVKDGDNKAIYINNVLRFSSTTSTAPILNIDTFFVGSGPGGDSAYQGLMDDFIVLDEALPATGARSVDTLFTQGGDALIPEPSSAALAGLVAAGGLAFRRRRHR